MKTTMVEAQKTLAMSRKKIDRTHDAKATLVMQFWQAVKATKFINSADNTANNP